MTCFAVAVAAVAVVGLSDTAQAGAPMAKGQSGWYRMTLGDFEITALSDGTAQIPMQEILSEPKDKASATLTAAFLAPPFDTSVNAFLVNTGSKLVLIDAGAGGLFGPTLGKLIGNLKASGYQPAQVDEIVITHLHADHIGNLVSNGKLAFPNATVHAGKADADFWLNEDNAKKYPDAKDFIHGAQASINPIIKAGKFKTIEGEAEIVPGIKAIPAPGHTPGHTIYEITSKGQKMVAWGDLMHVAAVQFPNPSVTIKFDSDPKAAMAQREKAFADAAKNGYFAAIAHVPFPGIGHLRAAGTGYEWFPVNYENHAAAK